MQRIKAADAYVSHNDGRAASSETCLVTLSDCSGVQIAYDNTAMHTILHASMHLANMYVMQTPIAALP